MAKGLQVYAVKIFLVQTQATCSSTNKVRASMLPLPMTTRKSQSMRSSLPAEPCCQAEPSLNCQPDTWWSVACRMAGVATCDQTIL